MSGGQVSIKGSDSHVYTLDYDTRDTFVTAQQLASQINAGIDNGSIVTVPHANTAPFLNPGQTGEFVQTRSGEISLPPGYKAVVDAAQAASITGSADNDQSVLGGSGDLSFRAHTGSGTVVAGGGADSVRIDGTDQGDWLIALGNGDDTVNARGTGSDTISLGSGNDLLRLGAGRNQVTTQGPATVLGGAGSATIFAGGDLTFFGSSGDAEAHGGQGGDNVFFAGTGNETLVGAAANCGHGSDAFVFFKGAAGGNYMVENFTAGDQVDLQGYSSYDIQHALRDAQYTPQGATIRLSDNTQITFTDVSKLDPKSFIQS